MVLGQGKHL